MKNEICETISFGIMTACYLFHDTDGIIMFGIITLILVIKDIHK